MSEIPPDSGNKLFSVFNFSKRKPPTQPEEPEFLDNELGLPSQTVELNNTEREAYIEFVRHSVQDSLENKDHRGARYWNYIAVELKKGRNIKEVLPEASRLKKAGKFGKYKVE